MKTYAASTRRGLARGRIGLADVEALGLPVPKAVAQVAARLDKLEARRRGLPDDRATRAVTVAAVLEDPDADLAEPALAEWVRDVEAFAVREAIDHTALELAAVVAGHADQFIVAARKQVFEPAVETLTRVAALGGENLSSAVRAGRHDDAATLVEAPIAAAKVTQCLSMRDRFYRSETAGMPHRVWANPELIDWTGAESTTGLPRYLHGIRHGGRLHLAVLAELEDLAREADRARRAAVRAQYAAA